MNQIDTLISARWVLPILPRNVVYEHYSVAIHNGLILDVLPTNEALQKYQPINHLRYKHHVIMPGLINAHTHASMNLFRGLADDLPLLEWLQNHIWPMEQKMIHADSIQVGMEFAIAEMIRGGTTYFNDMYFFPSHAAEIVIKTGMRASIGMLLMNVPTKWAQTEDEYLKKIEDVYLNRPDSDSVDWLIAPQGTYTNSDTTLRAAKELSDQYNLCVHMHANETLGEIGLDMDQYHCRPLARIEKAGLLNQKLSLAHMVHLTDEERILLKDNNVHVVHCPESNMKLGSGFSDMSKLTNLGVNVALGSDGAASNNDLDMFSEMRSAAFMAKGITQNPTVFPAHQVLEMATINGAKALGLENKIGSLEQGKSADLIAVDLSHYFTQPVYNPVSLLVYSANRLQVSDLWVKGKQLLREEQFTTIDIERVVSEANDLAASII